MLLTHIVIGSIVSVMAGSLSALIAGENSRAPLAVGFGLLRQLCPVCSPLVSRHLYGYLEKNTKTNLRNRIVAHIFATNRFHKLINKK